MIFLVAALVVFFDQFVKWIVVTHMAVNQAIPVIPGILEWLYIQNRGAAFSMLLNQRALLIGIALVVVAAIIYANRTYARGKRSLQIALGCLMGGATGNLLDRILHGYVIDYIYVSVIHYPVFNIADSAIVLSVFYMVWRAWFRKESTSSVAENAEEVHSD
ncbi:signal peptidase II [Ferroacidibacillus organovorans]|uniref:Lipoprotein signal peptidase n=1 Tax=Ferroacidibacillus organovorans TaxID=1765683 RepID=A0A853KAT7_9BACL|nr:signal peptidase II [Ferroacidibacillus organovorans]KYP81826.1 hypothetical protein AYJ22_05540 [Ferroacidibacillus organovorans]OAG94172.1 hypothetical protein AYW79_06570 [Ferroacidibacillus organovorans]